MVNRLIEPTSGRIELDGDDVTDVDPVQLRRRIGYVIQASGLFPHQKVRQNVITVPSLLGWDKARARSRADELLELVGLPPDTFGDRYPHELSGGQQQRVGVARALGADPDVLLMDEPFGAVDPIQRDRLQEQFHAIQTELEKTVLLVTHDIDEAIRLADRVAVLSTGGHLEQVASPVEILGAPANDFVAQFVGAERGLRRLAVTPIDRDGLEQPPTLYLGTPLERAREIVRQSPEPYAVVVDDSGNLRGWVGERELGRDGSGTLDVAARARRFDAVVQVGDSLRRALGEIVQHDAGWLPVVDGDRYLGVLTPTSVYGALRRATPEPAAVAASD
jgi:osmoprotectant transport system ATP-binding protein